VGNRLGHSFLLHRWKQQILFLGVMAAVGKLAHEMHDLAQSFGIHGCREIRRRS